MEEIKIKWPDLQEEGFSENYSSGLKYALCSEKYEQSCGFVWCKDFLQDAYLAYLHKNSRQIYGFKYSYSKNPSLSMKCVRILLTNCSDANFAAKMRKAVNFLNQIEKELKMLKKTVIYKCVDPPKMFEQSGVFLVEGNKRWMISPPMLSLYTLLIRVGCKYMKKHGNWRNTCKKIISGDIKGYQTNDSGQLKSAMKGIEHIIKFGDRKIFGKKMIENYPKDINTSSMHHECGIVSFSNGYNNSKFPGWYAIPFEKSENSSQATPCAI